MFSNIGYPEAEALALSDNYSNYLLIIAHFDLGEEVVAPAFVFKQISSGTKKVVN